jgi:predicted kinase
MKPLTPSTPHVIILVGIPGAGKTYFAKQFAETFSAPYLDVNTLQLLTEIPDKKAAELSSLLLDEFLKTGRTVIFEGPTHARTYRDALMRRVRAKGYEPLLVWVQTEPVTALARLKKGSTPASFAVYEERIKRFSPPHIREGGIVISGRHTYATQARVLLKRLAGERPAVAPPTTDRKSTPRRHSIRIS